MPSAGQSGQMTVKNKIEPFPLELSSGENITLGGGNRKWFGIFINSGHVQTHILYPTT